VRDITLSGVCYSSIVAFWVLFKLNGGHLALIAKAINGRCNKKKDH
jgi:hypothetical protein